MQNCQNSNVTTSECPLRDSLAVQLECLLIRPTRSVLRLSTRTEIIVTLELTQILFLITSAVIMSVKESFEEQFGGLLSGTLDMFTFAEIKEDEGAPETDVDAIYKAEQKVEELHRRGKEVVDSAREEVRGKTGQAAGRKYRVILSVDIFFS